MTGHGFLRYFLSHPLLLLILLSLGCDRGSGRAVIFISLDTLRQDHLGCYGYSRDTTPRIDAFAREDAVRFDTAVSQAPYTLTSHMSMLTGLYPEAHDVLEPWDPDGTGEATRLRDAIPTLAEAFAGAGFRTAAFTDGIFLVERHGFDQGFERFDAERRPEPGPNGFQRMGGEVRTYIREHRDEDFFLFIHTFDTHLPYAVPEPFRSRFKGGKPARDLPEASLQHCSLLGCHSLMKLNRYKTLQEVVDEYDGCIAYVDHEVGRILDLLKAEGLWEEALVVITSDHGESFMENGLMIGHGLSPTREEVRVPLLIKFPGSVHGGRSVDHVVESVDIMPTLLAAAGIPEPARLQGQDLLAGVDRGQWEKDHGFGTSPYTGGNHYLLKNGIKFIGAVTDPDRRFIKAHLLPRMPVTLKRPEEPYFSVNGNLYFYDFETDPLGVEETFLRGDRAYDLARGGYEWRTEPVRDSVTLLGMKEAAHDLAERSRRLGNRFGRASGEATALSDDELEGLESLGYGGAVTSDRLVGNRSRENETPVLEPDPARTDRTLLIRGDRFAWAFKRAMMRRGGGRARKTLDRMLDEARADYAAFEKAHPDHRAWVDWRIRYLDMASRILVEGWNAERRRGGSAPGR